MSIAFQKNGSDLFKTYQLTTKEGNSGTQNLVIKRMIQNK